MRTPAKVAGRGAGPSGMGAYHGVDGFAAFSKKKGNLIGPARAPGRRAVRRTRGSDRFAIDDAAVIRKVLGHLGLWAPQQALRRGVAPLAPDPPGPSSSSNWSEDPWAGH